jgi:sialate O-acetylesterase
MDATYINGEKVGSSLKSGMWQMKREYIVPAGLLKVGKNIIAIRVYDLLGGGGIYGKEGIRLNSKNAKNPSINLDGEWKYLPIAEIMNKKIYAYGKKETSFANRPKLFFSINQSTPTVLYNAMIYPIVPYTIQGVIWYQGEGNVNKAFEYRKLFPAMIECWRNVWSQGDFPFYYVQIAPWTYGEKIPSNSAELREAQLLSLKVPNTGMVVTTDIGDRTTIHPANKQEVGRRLALWALAKTYGRDSLTFSGPLFEKIDIEGNKITVHFTQTNGGLFSKGGPLTYFEIAGDDQIYVPAKAEIIGETVEVWSDKINKPVAVRFGWNENANPNLYNGAGLPASPFRSDSWKRLTEN